jgi:hypothetical protein
MNWEEISVLVQTLLSVSNFENFQIIAFALHSSMQINWSINMMMVANGSMNQLVNKICPTLSPPFFCLVKKKDMVL